MHKNKLGTTCTGFESKWEMASAAKKPDGFLISF